jgi:hypothetical protein
MANSGTTNRTTRDVQKPTVPPKCLLPILAWPVVCAVLGIVLWTMTLTKLGEEKAALEQNALKDASTLATAYAHQLTRVNEQLDQVTL